MTPKKTRRPPRASLGWTFTPEEERMARRAIRESNEYMKRYGKGAPTPDIDLSRYSDRIILDEDETALPEHPRRTVAGA